MSCNICGCIDKRIQIVLDAFDLCDGEQVRWMNI